jgi:hypothetical protein
MLVLEEDHIRDPLVPALCQETCIVRNEFVECCLLVLSACTGCCKSLVGQAPGNFSTCLAATFVAQAAKSGNLAAGNMQNTAELVLGG